MVNQSSTVSDPSAHAVAFEEFAVSLFRFTRTIRSTSTLWVQLPGGLKRSDVTILRTLSHHGECRPSSIAEVMGVGPSVISRQLVALGEQELVVRRRDPVDGRAELIALTPVGRERLDAMREAYVAGMQEQFTDWDEAKVRAAAALLEEISDHIAPALGRDSARATNQLNDKEPA
ncbi:winged helix-turn-helix transcriptional regulator [Nocardioides sp. JQ2195]|uniref:MarR family winged helix-turn-helix transcriptional regulator n=1 Tax=Nocardioides sp. JQ2195 TaxID=2592334 RepID=UPI00143E3AD5|nr:MarR family winged helix-turn-helix transcriptional regulator [Nocardioides sp. JQ2195]QIX27639.1 winged helix-turn-helix transcriptional regulator [Nocardioides sp. JQ2195]